MAGPHSGRLEAEPIHLNQTKQLQCIQKKETYSWNGVLSFPFTVLNRQHFEACSSFCMLHGDVSRCVFVHCAGLASCQWSEASDVLFNTPLSLRLSWSSSHCQSVTGNGANLGPETLFSTMLAVRQQCLISLYEAENRSRSWFSIR